VAGSLDESAPVEAAVLGSLDERAPVEAGVLGSPDVVGVALMALVALAGEVVAVVVVNPELLTLGALEELHAAKVTPAAASRPTAAQRNRQGDREGFVDGRRTLAL
jgi:hypothetical protein